MASRRAIDALDLVGGTLALDFANTVSTRAAGGHDYLGDYRDLLDWAGRARSLAPDERDRLLALADADPRKAADVIRIAHRRRDAVFTVFSAIAAGRPAPAEAVRGVLEAYGHAVAAAEAAPGPSGASLRWPATGVTRPLRPIEYDAGRLLLSDETRLVKECPDCGWLFLDRSRNRSRRWCDMQVCGSRAKMRRYRRAAGARPA